MVLAASQNGPNPNPPAKVPAVILGKLGSRKLGQRPTAVDAEGNKPPRQVEPSACNPGSVGGGGRGICCDNDDLVAGLVGPACVNTGAGGACVATKDIEPIIFSNGIKNVFGDQRSAVFRRSRAQWIGS